MAKSGWSGGRAPAQGAADSPHFGSAKVGSGFAWGIRQGSCGSKSAVPIPADAPNKAEVGLKPRPGNWGEGFQNHH